MRTHEPLKHTRCEIDNCNICDGGLFVCVHCNRTEIELEQPCVRDLFLIDASALMYRGFHVKLDPTSPDADYMQVPLVFARIVERILRDYKPEALAIAWDAEGPTFRENLYPAYKAHRPPCPDALVEQKKYVLDMCQAKGWTVYAAEGFEADDVMATLARQAEALGIKTTIVANDKDLLQMVGPNIRCLRIANGEDILIESAIDVMRVLGVPPNQVVDLLALMGDSSDGVPGGAGIGEVGALTLLRKYKSLEGALKLADYVANKKYRKALRQRDDILLSRTLVTLREDAPVTLQFDMAPEPSPFPEGAFDDF